MLEKIIHWIFFGVLLSALPLALALGIYAIIGLPIETIDYVPDLLLVAFAIIINTLGNSIGSDKNLPKGLKMFNLGIAIFFGFICFGGYFALFGISINPNGFQIKNLSIVTEVTIWISVFHGILGVLVEIISHHNSK